MTAPGAYRDRPLPEGTRMIRMRTSRRWPQQGQPGRPVTHPSVPHAGREAHTCAECFGPRSRYRTGPFCYRCEEDLFGNGRTGYEIFVRSERQRRAMAARKAGKFP